MDRKGREKITPAVIFTEPVSSNFHIVSKENCFPCFILIIILAANKQKSTTKILKSSTI